MLALSAATVCWQVQGQALSSAEVSLVATDNNPGMDPGMRIGNAIQARYPAQFQSELNDPVHAQKHYQLIAVAEQGRLQDSRPFAINSGIAELRQNYYAASDENVAPFFFEWKSLSAVYAADGNELLAGLPIDGQVASLFIDTATRPYYYRNRAVVGGSVSQRDLARIIYRQLPADYADPTRSQLLNSLDDHVHLAFFENDRTSSTSYMGDLRSLGYSAVVKSIGPALDYSFNYQPGSDQLLKPGLGSRIVTSVGWAEDANGDGQREQYLIELNTGGQSGNPYWQKQGLCVQNTGSHAGVISGQYMVLGEAVLQPDERVNLGTGSWQALSVDWGRILQQLTQAGVGSSAAGDCRLNATLDALDNSISVGMAIEVRGAVTQGLLIAGARLDVNSPLGSQSGNNSVTVQTESLVDTTVVDTTAVGPAVIDSSLIDNTLIDSTPQADESHTVIAAQCQSNSAMQRGFYQFASTRFYVNGSAHDEGAAAFCRLTTAPADVIITDACGLPADIIDAGWCEGHSEPPADRLPDAAEQAFVEQVLVDGNTISWQQPSVGERHWYQVQSAANYFNHCEGGDACVVPAGLYNVINHSTGRVWYNVVVGR